MTEVEAARARMVEAIDAYAQAVTIEAGKEAIRAQTAAAGRNSWNHRVKKHGLTRLQEIARANGAKSKGPGRARQSADFVATAATGHDTNGGGFNPPKVAAPAKRERLTVWKK